ncbi:MAG: ABC-2 family transporter protein [Patescibacteria group bacterium]|jgi:ABC-2 type transport system permease protein
MLRYLKIWKIHVRAAFMQRMAYRLNFFMIAVAVIIHASITVIFFKVLFGYVNNIAGWNFNESMLIVGSFLLVDGLIWTTCAQLTGIPKHIKLGTLDGLIVKPISTQFLVSVFRADPEDWGRVATALFLLTSSAIALNYSLADIFSRLPYYIIAIACACVITYSVVAFARCLSFWFTEAGGTWYICENIIRSAGYPTDIYSHVLVRLLFSTVIPLAFMATVPAKIFIHGFDFWLILSSIALAVIFFFASRKFWKFALKHYSSASS